MSYLILNDIVNLYFYFFRRLIYPLVLFTLLFPLDSFSQSQDKGYTIVRYHTENGLPQNNVNAIEFDKTGYCWIATEMGLIRFDGKSFKEFTDVSPVKGSPYRIRKIAPDKNEVLHAQLSETNQGGLGMYIQTKEKQQAPFPVLVHNASTYIPVMGYTTEPDLIKKMDHRFIKRDKIPRLSSVLATRHRGAYLANEEQLYFISEGKVTLLSDGNNRFINGNHSTLINDLFVHIKPGNIISVWNNGIFKPRINKIQGVLSADKAFLRGEFQTFWCVAGTYIYCDQSLYRIDTENNSITSEKVLDQLEIPHMSCVYYAKKHNKYYIGSLTGGLFIIEPSLFRYPEIPNEASSQIFYPQSMTTGGDIFSNDILFKRNAKPQHLPLNSKDCMASYISPANQLFYEANFVLSRYDLATGKNNRLLHLDSRLRSIIPDGKNLIFFNGKSVGIIVNDSARLKTSLPGGIQITSACRLNKDNFLLSTDSGLKWYNLPENKIISSILDSLQIRTALPDDKGRIWIASYGAGYYLYENGKIFKMPHGPNHALKTVHAFIDDQMGYFWLPTNNGLFKVRKNNLLDFANGNTDHVYYYMFDTQNGLRSNEFNGGCTFPFVQRVNGMLSLSSMNGLVWFYPHKTSPLYPENNIYIDKLQIDNKKINQINNTVSLEPDFERLSLEVSSPYFGNSANEYIQFSISGLKNSWEPLPDNGIIVVGRSPAGTYKIMVRTLSDSKDTPAKFIELPFEVKPWFYNTWWFYSIVMLVIILISFLAVQIRLKSLRTRANQLKRIVDERTMDLMASLSELAHSEAALLRSTRIKDSVISMVLHDLRSPISFLNAISSYLAKNHTALDTNSLGQKLAELESGTIAINEFTQKFFDWARSQHEDFKLDITHFRIQDLFNEITALYQDILKINNNVLSIRPTELSCSTDYQILALVIRNLIDNANKNTKNGLIQLFIEPHNDELVISVSDTGTGLSPDQIKLFLDKDKVVDRKGIGSILILTMLDKINGKLDIISSPGEGSTISVKLRRHWQFHNA
jgi:signal transduction histidine kinase